MKKNQFYRIQAEAFWEYFNKFPDGDLLFVFDEWAESKDFSEQDRQAIFAKFFSRFVYKNKTND